MLSLKPVVELLKPPTTTFKNWFRDVGTAFEYGRLDPNNVPSPQAWVLPAGIKVLESGENDDTLEMSFNVVIAVSLPVKRKDDNDFDFLNVYQEEIYRRLRGKRLAEGQTRVLYGGGNVLRVTDKEVMWAETYKFNGPVDAYLDNPPKFQSVDYIGEST